MKWIRTTSIGAAAGAVFLATLGTECLYEKPPSLPPDTPSNTEPKYVLSNVEYSFNQRDPTVLHDALADGFVFYFDPGDVGRNAPGSGYVIPESWSKTEFAEASNFMFERAHNISMDLPWPELETPEETATSYEANNLSVFLNVMLDEFNGYVANRGYCNFKFKKKANGNWYLKTWSDHTGTAADGPTSLGLILATFYQPGS